MRFLLKVTYFAIVSLILLAQLSASAHHSRTNYLMKEFVEFEATVVEVSWKNPHVFAVVEVDAASGQFERMLLEMNSKPILTEMGWTGESLKVGDQIRIRGNPDRKPEKKRVFIRYVIAAQGEKLWSFGRPRTEAERQNKNRKRAPVAITRSTDFSGVWVRARVPASDPPKNNPFGPSGLAAAAAGEAALSNFNVDDDPSFECEPVSLPDTIVPVYPMKITRVNDALVTIDYEFNNGYREIHLGRSEFPDDIEPSRLGYSIGRIEHGALIVESKYFNYDRWGNGRGLPSSEQKQVFERYTLTNEGARMEVEYSVKDPVYLKEAAEPRKGAYVLRNGMTISDFNCDPDAAVRHLGDQ